MSSLAVDLSGYALAVGGEALGSLDFAYGGAPVVYAEYAPYVAPVEFGTQTLLGLDVSYAGGPYLLLRGGSTVQYRELVYGGLPVYWAESPGGVSYSFTILM